MTIETLLGAGADPTVVTTPASTTPAAEPVVASTTPATDPTATPAATDPAAPAATVVTDPAAKPAADVAPEKYTDFTVPKDQELAPDVATEIGTLAKELNLSQDKAQKVFDTAAKLAAKGAEAQQAVISSVHAGWIAEVRADKEVGGDKLAANLATAKAAMEASTTPQLRMLLEKTGLGNNVEVIRHFLKIAPAFKEGTHVPGGLAPTGDKSAAKVLYPNNA